MEWIVWLSQGVISMLLVIVSFWIRRWINQLDQERATWIKEGGLITRTMFHELLREEQLKCPAIKTLQGLSDWRNDVLDRGGIMTKPEHAAICKENTREIADNFYRRLDELFEHHREWVGQELRLIRVEISKAKELNGKN